MKRCISLLFCLIFISITLVSCVKTEHTTTFDKKGNVVDVVSKYKFNKLVSVTTETPNGPSTKRTYDSDGSSTEYGFDSYGREVYYKHISSDGSWEEYNDYSYLGGKEPFQKKGIDSEGFVLDLIVSLESKTKTKYDADGKKITEINISPDSYSMYQYNPEGKEISHYFELGNFWSRSYGYEYDNDGNLVGKKEDSSYGNKTEYKYDSTGNIVWKKIEDDNFIQELEYDTEGNQIGENSYFKHPSKEEYEMQYLMESNKLIEDAHLQYILLGDNASSCNSKEYQIIYLGIKKMFSFLTSDEYVKGNAIFMPSKLDDFKNFLEESGYILEDLQNGEKVPNRRYKKLIKDLKAFKTYASEMGLADDLQIVEFLEELENI